MMILARITTQSRQAVLFVSVFIFSLVLTGCASRATNTSGPTVPSAPANVAAVAIKTQINISWTASTASLGVAAYLVERCQGANCTNFVQIASLGGTANSYSDNGLASNAAYSYRVRAQDTAGSLSSYSNTATATTNSTVGPPVITSSPSASGTVGTPFSYQITASNSPTNFGASGLPAGLAVSTSTGLISGTPAVAGTSNVTVSATNSGGTGSASLILTIASAPVPPIITSSLTASATAGASFSYQISATNSPASFAASGLPAGLTINPTTGLISGTPTVAGTSNVTISATNSAGTGSAALTLTVTTTASAPVITSATTATGTVGTAFSYQIIASNSPTGFGASGLPAGLAVNTSTGLISGTPTLAGTSNVTVSATNKGGTGTATLTLTVSGSGRGPVVYHSVQISSDADDG